jgi:hypothetical protein
MPLACMQLGDGPPEGYMDQISCPSHEIASTLAVMTACDVPQ